MTRAPGDGHAAQHATHAREQPATSDDIEANKTMFRAFYDRAWNGGEANVVDTFLSPTFINHMLPPHSTNHREHYRQAILDNRRLFPDYQLSFIHLVGQDDMIAAHWRATCTVGDGAPPGLIPGTPLETSGITLVRIANGRITDFWKYDNAATVLALAARSNEQTPA